MNKLYRHITSSRSLTTIYGGKVLIALFVASLTIIGGVSGQAVSFGPGPNSGGGGDGTTNTVHRQATAPTTAIEADLWQDTDDNAWYAYDDGVWRSITTASVQKFLMWVDVVPNGTATYPIPAGADPARMYVQRNGLTENNTVITAPNYTLPVTPELWEEIRVFFYQL